MIKNLYPITIEEKLEVLLLDENVRKKKNKNMFNQLFPEETPFLNSEIFKIKEGNDEVITIKYDKEDELFSMFDDETQVKNFPLLDDKKMENLFIIKIKYNFHYKLEKYF